MATIERDLQLTDELRAELKKPFGRVAECSEIAESLKESSPKPLITIGDSVSSFMLKEGVEPSLIIWDGKTERRPVDEETRRLLAGYAPPQRVENPPGTISRKAWETIESSISGPRASVRVEGEEDLLVLPAVLAAPEGTRIVYGFPPGKGAILIVVGRKIKSVFQELLSRFE